MQPIHLTFKIEAKHWNSYIKINIRDIESPDAEDAIEIQPSTPSSDIYRLGMLKGSEENIDIGLGTSYQVGFRGPIQVVEAIELIFKENYFPNSSPTNTVSSSKPHSPYVWENDSPGQTCFERIPDLKVLKQQLIVYQLNVKNKAVQTIQKAMQAIVDYPFDGKAWDPAASKKRVPFVIHEVFRLLQEARTRECQPLESFNRLGLNIERQFIASNRRANPSSFFTLQMPGIYREIIDLFKLSPLLCITSENRNHAIESTLQLPKPIVELVCEYADSRPAWL